MNINFKILVTTISLLLAMMGKQAFANNKQTAVDPSDLTQTVTQALLQLDSDSNLKLAGSMSGQFSEGHQYMGSIEVNLGKNSGNQNNDFGASYLGSRTQFFGAFNSGINFAPKVGYSVDYSHFNDGTTLTAVGGLFLINPALTHGFMIFPNVAYATGTIENSNNKSRGEIFAAVEEFPLVSDSSINVDGFLANLFISKKINKNGAFIMTWPEYIDVSGGDLIIKQLTLKVNFGMPINEAKNLWFNVIYEYKKPQIMFLNNIVENKTKTKIYLGIKRYF